MHHSRSVRDFEVVDLLTETLLTQHKCNAFQLFLQADHSEEFLLLWAGITEYEYLVNKGNDDEAISQKANSIWSSYVALDSERGVGLPDYLVDEIGKLIEANKLTLATFREAKEISFSTMANDSFPRFLRKISFLGLMDFAVSGSTRRIHPVVAKRFQTECKSVSDWKARGTKKDIHLFTREYETYECVKAFCSIPSQPDELFDIIWNSDGRREWDPFFEDAVVLKDVSVATRIVHYKFKVTALRHATKHDFLASSSWYKTSNGAFIILERSIPYDCPEIKGTLRGEIDLCGWLVEASSVGCMVTCMYQINFRGSPSRREAKLILRDRSLMLAKLKRYADKHPRPLKLDASPSDNNLSTRTTTRTTGDIPIIGPTILANSPPSQPNVKPAKLRTVSNPGKVKFEGRTTSSNSSNGNNRTLSDKSSRKKSTSDPALPTGLIEPNKGDASNGPEKNRTTPKHPSVARKSQKTTKSVEPQTDNAVTIPKIFSTPSLMVTVRSEGNLLDSDSYRDQGMRRSRSLPAVKDKKNSLAVSPVQSPNSSSSSAPPRSRVQKKEQKEDSPRQSPKKTSPVSSVAPIVTASPRRSPKVSPRRSPKISPRKSPLSPRKTVIKLALPVGTMNTSPSKRGKTKDKKSAHPSPDGSEPELEGDLSGGDSSGDPGKISKSLPTSPNSKSARIMTTTTKTKRSTSTPAKPNELDFSKSKTTSTSKGTSTTKTSTTTYYLTNSSTIYPGTTTTMTTVYPTSSTTILPSTSGTVQEPNSPDNPSPGPDTPIKTKSKDVQTKGTAQASEDKQSTENSEKRTRVRNGKRSTAFSFTKHGWNSSKSVSESSLSKFWRRKTASDKPPTTRTKRSIDSQVYYNSDNDGGNCSNDDCSEDSFEYERGTHVVQRYEVQGGEAKGDEREETRGRETERDVESPKKDKGSRGGSKDTRDEKEKKRNRGSDKERGGSRSRDSDGEKRGTRSLQRFRSISMRLPPSMSPSSSASTIPSTSLSSSASSQKSLSSSTSAPVSQSPSSPSLSSSVSSVSSSHSSSQPSFKRRSSSAKTKIRSFEKTEQQPNQQQRQPGSSPSLFSFKTLERRHRKPSPQVGRPNTVTHVSNNTNSPPPRYYSTKSEPSVETINLSQDEDANSGMKLRRNSEIIPRQKLYQPQQQTEHNIVNKQTKPEVSYTTRHNSAKAKSSHKDEQRTTSSATGGTDSNEKRQLH